MEQQANLAALAQGAPPQRQRDMEALRAYLASQGVLGDFNAGTRESYLTQPSIPFVQSQPQKVNMPQTGFLSDVQCLFSGTTTTAAASSTTVKSYIPPGFGIARRVRLFSNQGVDIWNTSGWGMANENVSSFRGVHPMVINASQFNYSNAFGAAQTPFTRYFNAVSSLGASAVNNWRFPGIVSVAWGAGLQAGLQLLQDPAIQYALEVTWGDLTDLYSSTTGTVTLSAVQCLPTAHIFHVPERAIDLPKLSYSMTTIEDTQALTTGSGENTYKFTTGNVALEMILELVNTPAGVQTPLFPTGASADASVNPVSRLKVRYSQTQIPYDEDADTLLFLQRQRYGQDMPGGVYIHDFDIGNGLPELVTTRDVINTARLTDLDFITTLQGVTLTNAFFRGVRQQLVRNR